jgi:hypothetical protein
MFCCTESLVIVLCYFGPAVGDLRVAGKGAEGLVSLVIRFFFLYRRNIPAMLLVGSVSFFNRSNGMSLDAGICGLL